MLFLALNESNDCVDCVVNFKIQAISKKMDLQGSQFSMDLVKADANYISIGNKCETAIRLKQLNLRTVSLPFDYIPTRPDLILKYIQSEFLDFLPIHNKTDEQGNMLNGDGVWFGHFFHENMSNEEYLQMVNTFEKRCKRLLDIFNGNNKIVLVYSSLGDIYNELDLRYKDNYSSLVELCNYLTRSFNSNFTILAFHTNQHHDNDDKCIINCTIDVNELLFDSKYSQRLNGFYGDVFGNAMKTLINGDSFESITYTKSDIDASLGFR